MDEAMNNEKREHLEVVIVGAGPIGLACGIEAEKRDLSYRVLEKGCLINSIYHFPVNMRFFSTADRLEIGEVPFVSHGDKPTRSEVLEYYRRVKQAWGLRINPYERVTGVRPQDSGYRVISEKGEYEAGSVVIATGYYDHPNRMEIPGENLGKVSHYFREAHPYGDQKVVVVGGGNSAVDAALECFRRGAEVTLAVQESALKETVKYWVKPDIENRIEEGSIKAFFNTRLKDIREKEVDLETENGLITVANDFVLAMTGYRPDYDFLKRVGIILDETDNLLPYFNPETFETNLPGVYLAGVVCGGMNTAKWFIENAREHPLKIFAHITAGKRDNRC
jgi:thioredoxin reductase (NADPH)